MSKLRIGQLGCGYWGKNLLRVLNDMPPVDIVRVIDLSYSNLATVHSANGSIDTGMDEDMVICASDVDAVVIATPAGHHFPTAKRCLQNGKHVFIEKPFAMSKPEAVELVSLAESNGLTLMAGHIYCYNAVINYMKQYIESGELGDIYYLYSRRLNFGIVRPDVDVLWNLAPHDVSILQYLAGGEPELVVASGHSYVQSGIADVVFASMVFPVGILGNIHIGWHEPVKVREVVVVGSRKSMVMDDTAQGRKLHIHDINVAKDDSIDPAVMDHRRGKTISPDISYPEPLREELWHFIDCIANETPPITGGYHAISVVSTIERIQQAMSKL